MTNRTHYVLARSAAVAVAARTCFGVPRALALGYLLLWCQIATGQAVTDQTNTSASDAAMASVGEGGDIGAIRGQSFTVGLDGTLSRIEFNLANRFNSPDSNPILVKVVAGLAASTEPPVATAIIDISDVPVGSTPAFVSADFSGAQLQVQAGDVYTVWLSSLAPSLNHATWWGNTNNSYSRGRGLIFGDDVGQFANPSLDFAFKTFVVPGQVQQGFAYLAYVANQETSNVSVIDTSTNAVASSLTVNTAPYPFGIAVAPDAAHVYVSNRESNSVSVLDTATNAFTAIVSVGTHPYQIAITPDGTRAYVANVSSGNVSVIDTVSNSVVATVTVGNSPFSIALTPDGKRAYVPNLHSHNVSVIDAATNSVIRTISVGLRPEAIAITPDGAYAYVANQGHDSVSVIDIATNTLIATIAVGRAPESIAITPDGAYAYVGNHLSYPGTVSVIDISSNTVAATVVVGTEPNWIAVRPDGLAVYVANSGSHNVSVIDTATNTVTTTIPLGVFVRPRAIAITPIRVDIDTDDDDLGVSVDNCPRVFNPDQVDTNNDGIGDACDDITPAGLDVIVSPAIELPDGAGTATVDLTFESITTGGTTTVSASTSPSGTSESPAGFQIGTPPVYYEISTTAEYSGSIALCFSWLEGQFSDESSIMLFHFEEGAWTNVTTSLNTTDNEVCGLVTSLSPFALFESSFAGFFAPVDNPPVRNSVRAGAGVPVRFSLGGDYGLSILAPGSPGSQSVSCDSGSGVDAIEETVTAGNSGLTYDAGSDLYTYVWKTDKAWAKTCRRLVLTLASGSTHTAEFSFAK